MTLKELLEAVPGGTFTKIKVILDGEDFLSDSKRADKRLNTHTDELLSCNVVSFVPESFNLTILITY